MKYALLSVFDKEGIVDLAVHIQKKGYKIISTGGTAKHLTKNGVQVIPIQDITENPESFDGRVKTISYQVEGGILFDRTNPDHVAEAKKYNIKPIDIVICNLYPFEETSAKQNVKLEEVIENIDVGGPTMVRSAAKNFKNVTVVVDPNDYKQLIENLRQDKVSFEFKKTLAAKAFAHLSLYDSQIASFLNSELFSTEITIPGRLTHPLRYGDNPHQKAAFYTTPQTSSPIKNLKKLSGRDLSATNVEDISAGIDSIRLFTHPAAVIIKHNNPCGIALGDTIEIALNRAILADPESAFGGVIVLNKPLDEKTARVIASFKNEKKGNIDIIATPFVEENAFIFLTGIRKSMGIYTFGTIPKTQPLQAIRFVDGGFILQEADSNIDESFKQWEIVTKAKPSQKQLAQAKLAWKFISRIRSNAIIVVDKDLPMTRGIGSGQTSRIRSVKIALEQAGKHAKGAILASDSFFPFDDSVKLSQKHGIAVIVQQGGSVNDKASIDAANEAGIAMICSKRRAFWH